VTVFDEAGLEEGLRASMKKARYEHTRGVVATVTRFAEAHGQDAAQARLAAWLHDAAKNEEPRHMKALAKKAKADAFELSMPSLWHAPAGAALARFQHGVRDRSILRAIRCHTTGAPRLDWLGRALFVADYCEPGRRDKGLKAIRKLAERDLDAAFEWVAREKLAWVIGRGLPAHPRALAAHNEAVLQRRQRA
jgi:predicted HD superfamily hydrolase involved in NAD metabolism